jgi:Fe-S cluster assembly iron-binding protein IscA
MTDLTTRNISVNVKNKKFLNCLCDNTTINLDLDNVYLPFGKEYFNGKDLLNIELINSNNLHNNYLSFLLKLEERIKNKNINIDINALQLLVNKKFLPTIKESKLGYIIRAHLTNSTDIYIEKKDKSKFIISNDNLKNTECNLKLNLKGIWINNDATTYGLLWDVTSIKINKFNE